MPSNTPNHGYYKPDSGEDGVADELNANWDAIDTALQGMSGDGKSAELETLSHTPAEGVPQSIHAGLSKGLAVALSADNAVKSVDPTTFATDDAALQALNDWLIAKATPTGTLYIPPTRTDGTDWTIESTVTLGDSTNHFANVSMECVGFGEGNAIETTITDGSAMFHFLGNKADTTVGRQRRLIGGVFKGGGQNVNPIRIELQTTFRCEPQKISNHTAPAIVLDTVANSSINNVKFRPASATTPVLKSENTNGAGSNHISDCILGPNIVTRPDYSTVIDDTENQFVRLRVGGYFEGARGNATFDIQNSLSRIYITPMAEIANTVNGTHGVQFNGFRLVAAPSRIGNIDPDGTGNGIVIDSSLDQEDKFWIWPYISFSEIGGDAISVNTDVAHGVVPYETAVVDETVSYPSGGWSRLRYTDGKQLRNSGTVTVGANSTVTANTFLGPAGTTIHPPIWWFETDPGADVDIDANIRWNSGSTQHALDFVNNSATAADIGYRVLIE